ncbi:MAG: uracil-DNA glycosylase [Alphaproteobacteria bacterium]|nr:uracil-DNA glycosylase [Alphaproteobacteria bacterium]
MDRAEAVGALLWQNEIGAGIGLSETPQDWFALSEAGTNAAAPPPTTHQSGAPVPQTGSPFAPSASGPSGLPTGTAPLQPDQGAIKSASEIATAAASLVELERALEDFEGCSLKKRATRLVFGDGNGDAEIMLIGEAPGRDEDIEGRPFVGRSGQLLDMIFAAIGLDRTKIYIANTVPWRPPGNRDPSPAELAVCRPFLERQVELVAPKIIVTLGAAATREIFGTTTGILRMRGQWRDIVMGKHACSALATLHPAYLLRQPAQKGLVWRDMLALQGRMTQ